MSPKTQQNSSDFTQSLGAVGRILGWSLVLQVAVLAFSFKVWLAALCLTIMVLAFAIFFRSSGAEPELVPVASPAALESLVTPPSLD